MIGLQESATIVIVAAIIIIALWSFTKMFKKDSGNVARKIGQESYELIESAKAIPKAFNEGLKEAKESLKETRENFKEDKQEP